MNRKAIYTGGWTPAWYFRAHFILFAVATLIATVNDYWFVMAGVWTGWLAAWLMWGGEIRKDQTGRFRSIQVIRNGQREPYMIRRHLLPHNRVCNLYLHTYVDSDDERVLHDHPWWSVSLCLKGELREYFQVGNSKLPEVRRIRAGRVVVRGPEFSHRLALDSRRAVTLFLTGPRVRLWGFHCPQGWIPYFEFQFKDGCGEFVEDWRTT